MGSLSVWSGRKVWTHDLFVSCSQSQWSTGWLVGMYLRTTQRKNRDGSVVRYVQLAHNRRVDGVTEAQVLVNLGREDQLDRDGLGLLVASISRYLGEPDTGLPQGGCRATGRRGPHRNRLASGRNGARFCWTDCGGHWGLTPRCVRCSIRAGSPPTWSGCCSRWPPTGRLTRCRSRPRRNGPATTWPSTAWRRWMRTRLTGRWTCWWRPTPGPGCKKRCSSPSPAFSTSRSTCCSSTPPAPTSNATPRRPARTHSASTGTPRTTGPTCRRSSSGWP